MACCGHVCVSGVELVASISSLRVRAGPVSAEVVASSARTPPCAVSQPWVGQSQVAVVAMGRVAVLDIGPPLWGGG